MLNDYVVPGDKLELTSSRYSEESSEELEGKEAAKSRVYHSKVYDIRSNEIIEIEMPMEKGKLILLPIGGEFDLCFYTATGLYQCYSVVKDRYKTSNVFILVMELTSGLRKFQRREYYRFNCVLDMKCRELSEEEQEHYISRPVEFLDTDLTLEDGVIVDISGGGARFVSDQEYKENTKILFRFSLKMDNGPQKFSVVGRVVKSNPKEGLKDKYENRIKFLSIDSRSREDIIRYIFEEERKIRRKTAADQDGGQRSRK